MPTEAVTLQTGRCKVMRSILLALAFSSSSFSVFGQLIHSECLSRLERDGTQFAAQVIRDGRRLTSVQKGLIG
jgi:hypothetical protein